MAGRESLRPRANRVRRSAISTRGADAATSGGRRENRERAESRSWPGERVPENGTLHVEGWLQEKRKRFCSIRGIQSHAVLGGESAGTLPLGRGVAVALPHRVHDRKADCRIRQVKSHPAPAQNRGRPSRES